MQIECVCCQIRADIDWSAGSCSWDLVWYVEWLDDYYPGITVIRISSVSWGFDTIPIRLGLRNFVPSLLLVIWLRRKKKKETERSARTLIWTGDQQRSIPAGLFDGGPSYCERAGKVKKRQASSLSLTIPRCHHPFPLSIPTPLNPYLFLQISPAPPRSFPLPLHPSIRPRQRHYVLTQPAKGTN